MHVRHDPDTRTFVAEDGVRQGILEYDTLGDGSLFLRRTFVHEDHRGQGIATGLVHCALGHALVTGRKVVPACPFVANLMASDPAFRDLRADRQPELEPTDRSVSLRYAVEASWA